MGLLNRNPNEAELDSLRNFENRAATLSAAMNDIERRIAYMLDTMNDAAPRLERFEEIAEQLKEGVSRSADAQASRYMELTKRLDAYDKVFKQLGVLIAREPTLPI